MARKSPGSFRTYAVDSFLEQHEDPPDLVIAKSVSTHAASWCAAQGIPAIWTTPLLTDPMCVDALSAHSAPGILVAGTADHAWDDDAAAATGLATSRVEGLDHGWQCGDWRREWRALGELASIVEGFAHSL